MLCGGTYTYMDRSSRSGSGAQQQQQLEDDDVPVEVLQNIQSRLPVKAAGRTSVLSKSWLHAWSTIPTLRFHHHGKGYTNTVIMMELVDMNWDGDPTRMKLKEDMDRTLMRYLRDNIPIETFELIIEFENPQESCLVEKWILLLATKTRVKELSIRLWLQDIPLCRGVSLNLPHEILSSENLTKLIVITNLSGNSARMTSSSPVIIKCVSLRELHLNGLHISQNILDGILSSCSSSLEKVRLSDCFSQDLDTIKVKNLPCLYELNILTDGYGKKKSTDFVISHLPNLRIFSLHVIPCRRYIQPSFNANLISLAAGSCSSVTQLSLHGLSMDATSLDLIKSGFPFLESLSLDMRSWMLGTFHFTRASLKSVSLLYCPSTLVDVQIHAPKLCYFRFESFDGNTLPTTLLFPISTTLDQLDVRLNIDMDDVDASFFVRMREALTLSRKCHLRIETHWYDQLPWDIDIKDLRTRLRLPPATNVQELWFETTGDECRWKRSPFFDAFFEICRPNEVVALPDNFDFPHKNHFRRAMVMEFLKNRYKNKTRTQTVYWPYYLEHVRFKVDRNESWKTLTKSRRRLMNRPYYGIYFKLKWR